MKPVYLLAIAIALGAGSFAIPAGSEGVETTAAAPQAAISDPAFLREASTGQVDYFRILSSTVTVPLEASLPSDFDNAHVEWCQGRYRSYNPRDNTWVSFSGRVRECDSPFW